MGGAVRDALLGGARPDRQIPGVDLDVVLDGADVEAALDMGDAALRRIGDAARARVLRDHTSAHRADELVAALERLGEPASLVEA